MLDKPGGNALSPVFRMHRDVQDMAFVKDMV
jgi:hypothetical protein